jgi:hypothetical protein
MGKSKGVYRVLLRKPERKRLRGRSRRRWEGDINMDLQEVRCEDSICLRIRTGGERL